MRARVASCWLALTIVAAACTVGTSSSVDVAAEGQLIRGVSMQWLELEKARNAAAIAGLFTEDGIMFREHQEPVVGTAAIIAYLDGDYAENPNAVTSWTTDRVDVAGGGDVATEYGTWSVANGGPAGSENDNGRYVTSYRKVNGTWKVVSDMSISTKPEESTPAAP